jgi:RNA polymerase sigma-70 factor (ECF subfamily)
MKIVYQSLSNSELVGLFNLYDSKACEEIYNRCWPRLWPHAKRMLQDDDAAKDVLHDAFISFFKMQGKLESHIDIKGYLYAIVRNQILIEIKNNPRSKAVIEDLQAYIENADPLLDPNTQPLEHLLLDQIEREIEALPTEMRKAFEMHHKEGLSHKQIAQKLGKSAETIKGQIKKSLKLIRSNIARPFLLYMLYVILYGPSDFKFIDPFKISSDQPQFFPENKN